jgi:hypothetical protein
MKKLKQRATTEVESAKTTSSIVLHVEYVNGIVISQMTIVKHITPMDECEALFRCFQNFYPKYGGIL